MPPALIVVFTLLMAYFGVNGNDETLAGANELFPAGAATIMAIAVGAMSSIYVATKTVHEAMDAERKLRYADYKQTDDFFSTFAGIFVTFNIALYFSGAAILAIAPYMLTKDVFQHYEGKDMYTMLSMGVMIVAGEWAGAYALGEVADHLLGWFVNYRATEVLVGEQARDISGWAFMVDVFNQSILTSAYFVFAIIMPAGTWTYAHYLLTGEVNWSMPYLANVPPLSWIF